MKIGFGCMNLWMFHKQSRLKHQEKTQHQSYFAVDPWFAVWVELYLHRPHVTHAMSNYVWDDLSRLSCIKIPNPER